MNKKPIETEFSAAIQSECSPILANLIWQTDPDLFQYFYDGDKSQLQKLLAAEWPSPVGFFSHVNVTIATQSNRPVGLLNLFAGKRMAEIYRTHIQLVPSVLEAKPATRLLKGLEAMGWLFPFVPHDAMYVLSLVVSQKARGEGLGAKLMAMAQEKAKSDGLKSIHLDCVTTSRAVKFFERLGYRPLVETRLWGLGEGETVPSHLRLVKNVS